MIKCDKPFRRHSDRVPCSQLPSFVDSKIQIFRSNINQLLVISFADEQVFWLRNVSVQYYIQRIAYRSAGVYAETKAACRQLKPFPARCDTWDGVVDSVTQLMWLMLRACWLVYNVRRSYWINGRKMITACLADRLWNTEGLTLRM